MDGQRQGLGDAATGTGQRVAARPVAERELIRSAEETGTFGAAHVFAPAGGIANLPPPLPQTPP